MKENNELLLHIYESSDMGVKATQKLLKIIKKTDNKIKKVVEDELQGYEDLLKEAEEIMQSENVTPKSKMFASMVGNLTMMSEIDKDNSDSKIADILTRGFSMGQIELEKKLKDYEKESSKEVVKLAKKSIEFQKGEIVKLKEYL